MPTPSWMVYASPHGNTNSSSREQATEISVPSESISLYISDPGALPGVILLPNETSFTADRAARRGEIARGEAQRGIAHEVRVERAAVLHQCHQPDVPVHIAPVAAAVRVVAHRGRVDPYGLPADSQLALNAALLLVVYLIVLLQFIEETAAPLLLRDRLREHRRVHVVAELERRFGRRERAGKARMLLRLIRQAARFAVKPKRPRFARLGAGHARGRSRVISRAAGCTGVAGGVPVRKPHLTAAASALRIAQQQALPLRTMASEIIAVDLILAGIGRQRIALRRFHVERVAALALIEVTQNKRLLETADDIHN